MKKIWIAISIVVVVALAISIIIIQTKKEPEVIKIGAILPLTGSGAEYGNDQKNGMLIALKEANSRVSPNFKILFEDSKGEPLEGVNAFKKLLLQKVSVVLTTLSGVSMAIAPLSEENKLVTMTVAAHPDLTKDKQYVIRMLPTATSYAKELARFIADEMSSPKIGILFANDDFGNSLKESFLIEYRTRGGEIATTESFEKSGIDFRSEVTKAISKKVEALFIVGYGKDLGLVIRQSRELGFKRMIYSTPEISYPDVQIVAGDALEGCIYISMWIDEIDDKVIKFEDLYKSTYQKEPSLDSYLGYDEVTLVSQAIESAILSGKSIRDELFKVKDFPGLTGSLTVGPNGDVRFPMVLKTLSKGKSVPLIKE